MLRYDTRSKIESRGFLRSRRRAKDKERARNALRRRWLPDNSVQRRHGLTAILAMMTVRRTVHGTAALHGLLRYGESFAIQCTP